MNGTKKPWSVRHLLAMAAAGAFPVLMLLLGFRELSSGMLLKGQALVFFAAVPVVTLLGCFLTIRSRHSAWIKLLLCILILATFFGATFFWALLGGYEKLESKTGEEALAGFEKASAERDFLPEAEELGTPSEAEYHHYVGCRSIFTWESDVLICAYSAENYQEQIRWMEEQYVFQREPVGAHGYTVEPEVFLDGYEFRMLSIEKETYHLDYPKYLCLIATNDRTREIVFMRYGDSDLDYIESLEEHILNDCGWKYIR